MYKTGIIVLMIATTLVVSATAQQGDGWRVGVEYSVRWDEMDQDEQYDTCVAQCSAAVNYRLTALRYALLKQKCRKLCQTSPSVSTAEALEDANLRLDKLDKDRIGVIWGAGIGGLETFQNEVLNFAVSNENPRFNPFFIPKMIARALAWFG